MTTSTRDDRQICAACMTYTSYPVKAVRDAPPLWELRQWLNLDFRLTGVNTLNHTMSPVVLVSMTAPLCCLWLPAGRRTRA